MYAYIRTCISIYGCISIYTGASSCASGLMAAVTTCVNDSNWVVREAAAECVSALRRSRRESWSNPPSLENVPHVSHEGGGGGGENVSRDT